MSVPKASLELQSVSARSSPQVVASSSLTLPSKKNLPTRADLHFLLGGSSKARARSSTSNAAAQTPWKYTKATESNQDSAQSSASIPLLSEPAQEVLPHVSARVQPSGAQPPSVSASEERHSNLSTSREARAQKAASKLPVRHQQATTVAKHEDSLPLGAEAVMRPDHGADSSFEADVEDEREQDDPNDRDFRLYDRRLAGGRLSRKTHDSDKADQVSARDDPTLKRKRGRPRLSSTTDEMAGGETDPAVDEQPKRRGRPPKARTAEQQPKRRGRPPKSTYTPELMQRIREAQELLSIAENDPGVSTKKLKLDDILDRKSRQALPPELREILLRARNTQLQRERRQRLRAQAEAQATVKKTRTEAKAVEKPNLRSSEVAKAGQSRKGKRLLDALEDENLETGSASTILERAKGKVSEWIKSISSEPGLSFDSEDVSNNSARWLGQEDDEDATSKHTAPTQREQRLNRASSVSSSSKQRLRPTTSPPPASAPVPAADGTSQAPFIDHAQIDPRLFQSDPAAAAFATDDDEERLVQGYFSRFATVTGADQSANVLRDANAERALSKPNGDADGPTYEAGVEGDDYYFST